MKSDIDRLLQERELDGLLVLGAGQFNPPMVYLTGGGSFHNAVLIHPRGQAPVLFHVGMERDEARLTGLATRSLDDYNLNELYQAHGGDLAKASADRLARMLGDMGLDCGRVALYGVSDLGPVLAVLAHLGELLPGLTLVGELDSPLLLQAMATKSEAELARMRRMGQITVEVVGQVADFLTGHRTENEVLVRPDGQPLTIGEVKRRINLWLLERGVENPDGTIFAIGADAGVPHSTGKPDDLLHLGRTIVFDIFPREPGGGYYYDFTRTWCLGYATDEALALHADVQHVYERVVSELRLGAACYSYQQLACELFEARGHPTLLQDRLTQAGYVHGLGHGVGLNVHERPNFSALTADTLQPGMVFTIEPGLYYPEQGLGMRLENTLVARPNGQFEVLADYPFDLVLPMR